MVFHFLDLRDYLIFQHLVLRFWIEFSSVDYKKGINNHFVIRFGLRFGWHIIGWLQFDVDHSLWFIDSIPNIDKAFKMFHSMVVAATTKKKAVAKSGRYWQKRNWWESVVTQWWSKKIAGESLKIRHYEDFPIDIDRYKMRYDLRSLSRQFWKVSLKKLK